MERGTFKSSNGKTSIHYYISAPQNPRAIVQFMHGMAEHSERYVLFANFLNNHGIAFCIADHLGHGKSINDQTELGYFGKNGWKHMVHDAATLTKIIKNKYPQIPFIAAGHSMGSFVCRAYSAIYPKNADACMFIGTGCTPKTVGMGKFAASFISFFKGEKYRSKLLDNLAFGSFNKKIPNSKSASDWLSRNEKNVQAYTDDELCGFVFTCDGFYNLFSLFEYVSSDKWAENLNKKTPVLLLAGKDDPVGHYGKDIVRISQELTNAGVKNVTEKLFENDRHEILNETDKEDVFAYILDWIENVI